jgi:glucosamine--fructose-6-phosphate aminotransferase (isomerizing)
MCGIVGYFGNKDAVPILLEGLRRLEYRGYDSAGVAVIRDGRIERRRSVGKLVNLDEQIRKEPISGRPGIGHTRWATHGRPSEENAHPHKAGPVVVVHNGIIENHLHLREALKREGHLFESETDTEVIAHLIYKHLASSNFESAVKKAVKELKGAYAIAVLCENEPDRLIAAKNGCPLVVGLGDGENFVASDMPAILSYTRKMIFLEDGDLVIIDDKGVGIEDIEGNAVVRTPKEITWSPTMAEKGGYRHFMLKEIFEQPRAITDTFRGRVFEETGEVFLDEVGLPREDIAAIKKIVFVSCGTSWHASLVGKFLIEGFGRIPVEVDYASEFRYRDPIVDPSTLIIAISQSGETADTLAAIREAKGKGARVLSICNVVDSTIARESHGVIYTHAGPEIGVASTKAFTSQLVALYLLTVYLGKGMGRVGEGLAKDMVSELVKLPRHVEEALKLNKEIEGLAKMYMHARDFLYLGRGINYPIALEGALKLKEISYIHAEGYPAGEMKHGPIALIDEDLPVVVLVPKGRNYEKVLSNLEEVRARGGRVIAVATSGDTEVAGKAERVIYLPETSEALTPILLSIPLQLLAYHIAVHKGTDVDQPRNLAKSVTVE